MNVIVADSHVHFHQCYDMHKFFHAAWDNFYYLICKKNIKEKFTGILFLTESSGENWYSKFLQLAQDSPNNGQLYDGIEFKNTVEEYSLKVLLGDEKELFIIAGRQIITEEKLEVLALGIQEHFGENYPVRDVISETARRGGIPVIPWGMGKWSGRRGEIVRRLISDSENRSFFLGDNGNRLRTWPKPSLFKIADDTGIGVLPGSDPLPFLSENNKVGSYAFVLKNFQISNKPFQEIKQKLFDSEFTIDIVGKLESPLRFMRNQLAMQFIKRMG